MAGRFQSRILSFFSRRRLKLIDRIKAEVRRLQLIASWGAQILLYPAYLAFQGGRLAGRQVRQRIAQGASQPNSQNFNGQPPPADAPLAKVFETIVALRLLPPGATLALAPESATDPTSLPTGKITQNAASDLASHQKAQPQSSPRLTPDQSAQSALTDHSLIQGLASQRDTRHLVLVTAQNQVLDVLTSAQQTVLRQRIAWELADYWQLRRFNDVVRSGTALPAMQYALPLPAEQPQSLPVVKQITRLMRWLQTGSIAMNVDLFQESRFADWPVNPGTGSPQKSWPQLPLAHANNSLDSANVPSAKDLDWLTFEELFNPDLQLMATEPLDYLSLSELNRSSQAADPASNVQLGSQPMKDATKSGLGNRDPSSPHSRPFTPSLSASDEQQPASDSGLSDLEPDPWDATNAAIVHSSPSAFQPDRDDADDTPVVQPSDPHSKNWIDTPSETVGYVKHPLERLLNWLDRWMVRLEKMGTDLWNRIQKLWDRR